MFMIEIAGVKVDLELSEMEIPFTCVVSGDLFMCSSVTSI